MKAIIIGGEKYDPKKEGSGGYHNKQRQFYFDWACHNPKCSEYGRFVDGCGLVLPAKVIVNCETCGTQETLEFDKHGFEPKKMKNIA